MRKGYHPELLNILARAAAAGFITVSLHKTLPLLVKIAIRLASILLSEL